MLAQELNEGLLVDNLQRGVVEPAMSKIKALRFATEAAIQMYVATPRCAVHIAMRLCVPLRALTDCAVDVCVGVVVWA